MQTDIRESRVEKTQELVPYKEEEGEIASGLLAIPAPDLRAAGEVGRGWPWWGIMP